LSNHNPNSDNTTPPKGTHSGAARTLSPEHRRVLEEESAIATEVLSERGYFTATDPAELEELGFARNQRRVPALVIPAHGVDGKLRFYRVRPDDPREDAEKPGKFTKYEQPAKTGVALDVPPQAHPALSDAGKRMWIVEGEKKADALVSRGECAIDVLGVWSWKRGGLPLPDWDEIRLVGREVFVAFDSDAARNAQVRLARSALARYLKDRGATVKIFGLRDEEDGSKVGADDFFAAGGTIEDLIDLSKEFTGFEPVAGDWPVMAVEAFHGLAGDTVRAIEPNSEADPAGLIVQLISVVGNVVGRGAHFKVEEDEHFCKINPLLVGETSKARKGTGLNRIRQSVKDVAKEWFDGCLASGLSSGEGLIHRLRDPVFKENEEGDLEVKDPGASDKRLLVEEPEFASPLTVMRREGNTLSMIVRNAWDDRPLENITKNSPERASDTHITIIGHITRTELLRHLNEEKLGAGIGNRFLFVLVKRSKALPHGGETDVVTDEQVRRLREAIAFGKEEREIGLSAEVEDQYGYSAKELWEEVYADLSEGRRGLFGAVVSRAEAYVRRVATVYAVLDLSEEVRVAHLLAALAVWQYSEQSAYLIFGDRTGDRLADELLEALKDAGEEGMTRNDIHDFFGRNQKSVRIGSVLRDLERQGLVRMEKEKTGEPGRPTESGSCAMRSRCSSLRINAYLGVPLNILRRRCT
jgi:hypothetical protein